MTTLPDVPYGHLAEFSEKRVEKEQFLCIGFHDSFWSRESEASTEWAAGGPFLIIVWNLDPELVCHWSQSV